MAIHCKETALILAERFFPEEFLVNSLAEAWQQQGRPFEVLTQAPSYPFGKVSRYPGYKNRLYCTTDWNGTPVHRFFTVQGYKSSRLLKILNYLNFVVTGTICLLFLGKRYHTVFIYQTGPLTMALPAVLLKRIFRFRIVIWTQDLWPDGVYEYGFKKRRLLSAFLDSIVRSVYRNCDRILVSCEGFIERLNQYTDKEILFLPQWSNFEAGAVEVPSEKLLEPGKFHLTFAGNISRHQNLENVILGFGRIAVHREDVCLNIVGDGYHLEKLQRLVAEKGIRNVRFHGRKPLGMIPGYLGQSDALVISLLGSPLLELFIPSKFQTYLSFGKPVVCLMNGAVKDIVLRAGIGVYGDPNEPEAIGKAMEKACSLNAGEKEQISRNCRMLLDTTFNREKLIGKITDCVMTSPQRG
jgi:glycosyltransferase involved in cell wall biosynthesis